MKEDSDGDLHYTSLKGTNTPVNTTMPGIQSTSRQTPFSESVLIQSPNKKKGLGFCSTWNEWNPTEI